jgi:phosphate transport system ATP-binding protein
MSPTTKLHFERFGVSYAGHAALHDLTLSIESNTIHAIIGPARSGKTSLLRSINLLASDVDHAALSGKVLLDGESLLELDRTTLRRRVGMVFATPQPLPGSIYDNLAFGPRRSGLRSRGDLDARVESGLKSADLWEEVKDRLHQPASALSGGQQQRLCIARSLALSPEVILLDEPCSGLDPISTFKIEQTLRVLKSQLTCVLVTNNTKQAARVSDRTAFMLSGELIEDAPTSALFTTPKDRRTADYVEGRFG